MQCLRLAPQIVQRPGRHDRRRWTRQVADPAVAQQISLLTLYTLAEPRQTRSRLLQHRLRKVDPFIGNVRHAL